MAVGVESKCRPKVWHCKLDSLARREKFLYGIAGYIGSMRGGFGLSSGREKSNGGRASSKLDHISRGPDGAYQIGELKVS